MLALASTAVNIARSSPYNAGGTRYQAIDAHAQRIPVLVGDDGGGGKRID